MSTIHHSQSICLNFFKFTALFYIITIILSLQVSSADSSIILRKIVRRAAYTSSENSYVNSYQKSNEKDQNGLCDDTGVIITRPCSYEECVESKYPYVGVCRRWDETEWSEKVKICFVVVNTPCEKQ